MSPGDAWGYDVGDLKELHPDLLFVEELLLSQVEDLVALGPGVNIWQLHNSWPVFGFIWSSAICLAIRLKTRPKRPFECKDCGLKIGF